MIEGVFFEDRSLTGGSSDSSHALHYFAKENDGGEVDLHFLKADGTSTGIVAETVPKADFEAKFRDCSHHDCQFKKKTEEEKKAERVAKAVETGWEHLENKEFSAATFELGLALKEDESNLEAHLGKGKAHMALGETDKAMEHFDAMADNENLYSEENKHTFNELGIELRENELYEEAVRNYTKAIEIDADDEILYYNLGRAYKEWGKMDEALKSINKAIELKPDFKEAKGYLRMIQELPS